MTIDLFASATDLRRRLDEGEIGAGELLEATLGPDRWP